VKLLVNETCAENMLFRLLDQMHVNIQSVIFACSITDSNGACKKKNSNI
jgi:hypothetical protein